MQTPPPPEALCRQGRAPNTSQEPNPAGYSGFGGGGGVSLLVSSEQGKAPPAQHAHPPHPEPARPASAGPGHGEGEQPQARGSPQLSGGGGIYGPPSAGSGPALGAQVPLRPRWGEGALEEQAWGGAGGHGWLLGGQCEGKGGVVPLSLSETPPQSPDGSPTYKNYVTE